MTFLLAMTEQPSEVEALTFWIVAMGFVCMIGAIGAWVAGWLEKRGRERNDRNRASLYDEWWRG